MNCLICKVGTYHPGMVNVKLERNSSILIIKEVPAEVCDTCSNYLTDQNTTKRMLELAEKSFKNGVELEVINLKAA